MSANKKVMTTEVSRGDEATKEPKSNERLGSTHHDF